MNIPIRVAFFGTPSFAVPSLQTLLRDKRFVVVVVVSQKEKPVGRRQIVAESAITQCAKQNGLEILLPSTLKSEEFKQMLHSHHIDIAVVVAYGKIIPAHILAIPRHGFVNIHGSLLPRYRGASPIQTALLNGDKKTGITIMMMDEKMDEGDILFQAEELIKSDDTYVSLSERLSQLGAKRLAEVVFQYVLGDICPIPQDHTKATYTKLITREMGKIDWAHETAQQIVQKLHAFTPWPGVYAFFDDKRIKILKASAEAGDISSQKGKVVGHGIQTIQGLLVPELVQMEGKNPVSFEEFLRGIRKDLINLS